MDYLVENYKDATCCLAYYLALLNSMADAVRSGEGCNLNASKVLAGVDCWRKRFLRAKQALSLSGGDAVFQSGEPFLFDGFQIVDGQFSGSSTSVDVICNRFYTELDSAGVLDDDMATRFELSVLAYMLSGEAERIRTMETTNKKKKGEGLIRKVVSFFKRDRLDEAV